MLWLTQRVKNTFILVDFLVELSLQLILTHSHQKVANQLGNSLSHCANSDFEDRVNTSADFLDENVGSASLWLLLLLLLLWLWRNRLSILVVLDWHLILLWDNRSTILLVVSVIDKHVVLL